MISSGDMKNAQPPSKSRLEDWDLFVLRHRKTPNILFHIVSFSAFWLSLPLALAFREPLWLIGFFSSGLIGTAGHYLFKDGTVDGKEASSSPQVVYFSSSMVLMFLTGRYRREIAVAEDRLREHLLGEIDSKFDRSEMRKKLGGGLLGEQESHPGL